MTFWESTHEYLADTFEKVCEKCGKKNKIEVCEQAGHNEREEYYCANCGQKMGEIKASNTPKTSIVYETKEQES